MTYDDLALDVERQMRRGVRFCDVEAAIDDADLQPGQAAALWLLALSYVPIRAQRRIARGHVAALRDPGAAYLVGQP